MDALQLRDSLHKYIDLADDRVLNLFCEIMKMDLEAKEPEVSERYYKLLEKELDETPLFNWDEVKKEMIETYNL